MTERRGIDDESYAEYAEDGRRTVKGEKPADRTVE